jgi:hypothetical protein
MKKYLKKLISNHDYMGSKDIQYSFVEMNCGNGYKNGTKHMFYSTDESDITLLINIIRRFKAKVIITNITKNSFEFESSHELLQIFFFRICRYVRSSAIKKILENTIMINKSGVTIQNAFLLAHYYTGINTNGHIPYFNFSMDGFYDVSTNGNNDGKYLNKPYNKLKDLIDFLTSSETITYNYLFKYELKTKQIRDNLFDLLKKEKFKKAEKYLLEVFK